MASFKKLLLERGCKEAATVLNSGNAVVSVPPGSVNRFVNGLADALRSTFGFEIPAVVSSSRDFQAVVGANSLLTPPMNPSRFLVAFTGTSEAVHRLRSMPAELTSPEHFRLGKNMAYLYCPDGISQSRTARYILDRLGMWRWENHRVHAP